LSIEEFHRLYHGVKPNHEYWFGEAVAKPMPTYLHGVFQYVMMFLLRLRGWRVASEVTLKISPELELVPDVIATRQSIAGAYPTEPVELCIEILSPDDRLEKTVAKCRHYLNWGVSTAWIVDPVARTAWTVTSEDPDGKWIHPNEALTVQPDTSIALSEIFAEVDKML
jgi:Uma2 family endonuclease